MVRTLLFQGTDMGSIPIRDIVNYLLFMFKNFFFNVNFINIFVISFFLVFGFVGIYLSVYTCCFFISVGIYTLGGLLIIYFLPLLVQKKLNNKFFGRVNKKNFNQSPFFHKGNIFSFRFYG